MVYGHTPTPVAEWINNTICLDTGCVFGGQLTALRWPEKTLVTVKAHAEHYEPTKPLHSPSRDNATFDLADVVGKRYVETEHLGRITVSEERNAAALEAMSRFTVDPRWLVYLPPTMAPVETGKDVDLLERPEEAFTYFKRREIAQVVCQEKHMGSRAVAIVAKNFEALKAKFGIEGHEGAAGMFITRTGRQFFGDDSINAEAVEKLISALTETNAWERHNSDWFMIDGEVLPWSAKAGDLIRNDFANVAAAGELWSTETQQVLELFKAREVEGMAEFVNGVEPKTESIGKFRSAYQHYVWFTENLEGVQFAPFTFLACEGQTLARQTNTWQMAECDQLAEADSGFIKKNWPTICRHRGQRRNL